MVRNIRLSGLIRDDDDKKLREVRASLLYHLFLNGWNIYNGNGDQEIHLFNIQRKIVEAQGFVFMPGATLNDLVKASSIFVGYQTGDMDLDGKPSIVLNSEGSWDSWLAMIDHLHKLGTVPQHYSQILRVLKDPKDVPQALEEMSVNVEKVRTKYAGSPKITASGNPDLPEPNKKLCVFCSASTKNPLYLDMGYQLGKQIAASGLGCVTGAGRTGIMGEVVRGTFEAGGWTGGSNVPHIIEMEGLPDGLNAFWPRNDIYTRMEIMIKKSAAFIILPGGMGTVQEALVLLHLKQRNDPLMRRKPIILIDIEGFWKPLQDLAKFHKVDHLMEVYPSIQDVVASIQF